MKIYQTHQAHWRVDGEEYKNSGESEKYGRTSTPPFMEDYPCYVGGWGTTEEGSQSDVFKSVNSMSHVFTIIDIPCYIHFDWYDFFKTQIGFTS